MEQSKPPSDSKSAKFTPNLQIWDTNVVRRAARNEFDVKKLKSGFSIGISPVVFLELCTKPDESFGEKKVAAKVALDHGTHFLPDPSTYLKFLWGIIDEDRALANADSFRDKLSKLADSKFTAEDAKRDFAREAEERKRAYDSWARDLEASRENIVQDPEFAKCAESKRSLGKNEIPRVQRLMGMSYSSWVIFEGTLDRITQDDDVKKKLLQSISARELKLAWMSLQVYIDIYRTYFEELLISGSSVDPNDKGDSELLVYLFNLRLLFKDVEPVFATFEPKWKRFAELSGWPDRVWELKP